MSVMHEDNKRIRILDVPVDMVSMDEALAKFSELMDTPEFSLIVTPNSEIIYNATKDTALKDIIENAALIIPDGIGLVYASKIVGAPLHERVTGIDFLSEILKWLSENGKTIYFLGSEPGVAEAAAEKMKEKFPELQVAGTHHGYYKPEEEADVAATIRSSGADFLCVAMGSPRQEKFAVNHADEMGVRAAIGVGGSLDVWSGSLKRAPAFFKDHGLEWLYRLIQEPARIKRMAALPLFILRVFFSRNK